MLEPAEQKFKAQTQAQVRAVRSLLDLVSAQPRLHSMRQDREVALSPFTSISSQTELIGTWTSFTDLPPGGLYPPYHHHLPPLQHDHRNADKLQSQRISAGVGRTRSRPVTDVAAAAASTATSTPGTVPPILPSDYALGDGGRETFSHLIAQADDTALVGYFLPWCYGWVGETHG